MRKFLTVLVFLVMTSPLSAQVTMRDVLKQMPDTLTPYLTANARLDLIDFIDSNMKAEVSNSLDGKSELLKLTETYALLALTPSSRLEMRLLDSDEPVDSVRQVLCVVRTYGTDTCESVVDFYSVHWRKLPAFDLHDPFGLFVATLGEQEPTLSLRPECSLDAPASEEQEKITKPSIILKWNGKTFNEY